MVVDGIYYALALSAGGAIVAYFSRPWFGAPLFVVALFCLYFFRDPDRSVPSGPVAVSPADGKVVAVKTESPTVTRVSIFLNIFDVHVNRTPISGKITDVRYDKGQFLVASKVVMGGVVFLVAERRRQHKPLLIQVCLLMLPTRSAKNTTKAWAFHMLRQNLRLELFYVKTARSRAQTKTLDRDLLKTFAEADHDAFNAAVAHQNVGARAKR